MAGPEGVAGTLASFFVTGEVERRPPIRPLHRVRPRGPHGVDATRTDIVGHFPSRRLAASVPVKNSIPTASAAANFRVRWMLS
ncbi:MAG: hypothetical protein DI536_16485 [Archangium gephyra]|uniref:Uncharacterized protein n=1 Tax=Archangium gephyra TaxID=48 RepID=A0A2W5TH66_9BACT|nr:MAG: hypothetical protein DI536_16485 [Archangium gephyra]